MNGEFIKSLATCPEIRAIALSGSKTSAINDRSSDWDIYIYAESRVPLEKRHEILSSFFPSVSIDCSPFEEGDEAIDEEGCTYDIMYRSIGWTEREIEDVWQRHNARLGYTTCFLYNISTSEILYASNGWFKALQDELKTPYPEKLRENIIKKNMDIIDGSGASTFLIQAELAWKRSDIVSQNHRLTAILASVFDIIFAYNKSLHPGEKKLLRYTELLCPLLPDNFNENVRKTILSVGTENYIPSLNALVEGMHKFTGL